MAGGVNSATESAEPANVAPYPQSGDWTLDGDLVLYAYWKGTEGLDYPSVFNGGPPNFERSYRVSGASLSGDVVIPEYHFGLRVGIIASGTDAQGAFGASITSISIPETVTQIGDRAFLGCSSLEGTRGPDGAMGPLVIPSGVTTVSNKAFYGCSKLDGVLDLSNVDNIRDNAFYGCSKLDGVILRTSSTIFWSGASMFEGCSELNEITLPDGMTGIHEKMFKDCIGLTHIKIPGSVTYIGPEAFRGCTSLQGTLDSSMVNRGLVLINVATIGNSAFNGCTALTSVFIPSSVTSMGAYAFGGRTVGIPINLQGDSASTSGWPSNWKISLDTPEYNKTPPAL
jgi:hypothetical protein